MLLFCKDTAVKTTGVFLNNSFVLAVVFVQLSPNIPKNKVVRSRTRELTEAQDADGIWTGIIPTFEVLHFRSDMV